MAYVAIEIGEKVEMRGFATEAEARAACRTSYSPYVMLFEGTVQEAIDDKLTTPVAVYVNNQGFICTRIEKDVPYTTYRVIPERLPQAEGFEAIAIGRREPYPNRKEIEARLDAGTKILWIIFTHERFVEVFDANDRKRYVLAREDDTLDLGAVLPGVKVAVRDLFEEVIVE